MKIYNRTQTVLDAALCRMRWLFQEFDNLVVDFSGGKDSTVCLNLALQVAEEQGKLPLKVFFLDQEAEWQTVIAYIREVMHGPRVEPLWHQIPILLSNATSGTDVWLHCWREGDTWMRPKEPDSIHTNVYGTNRFHPMFAAHSKYLWPDQKSVRLVGMRADESPARLRGLTSYETYKGETWGTVLDKKRQHYNMSPLYDWTDSDIWKAIHDHGWPYCRIYDYMYQQGVPVHNMRVSNLHHETAIKTLFYLQEVESATWDKLTARLQGINSAGQLGASFLQVPEKLPFMFSSWQEYRDYLVDRIVPDPKYVSYFKRRFAAEDTKYPDEIKVKLHKTHISSMLANDYYGTKMDTFRAVHMDYSKNRGAKGGYTGSRKTVA